MNLKEMIEIYQSEGLNAQLASARVCQDIILKAISLCSLNKNITIKGGIVMQNITKNIRRATRDIDLDFIHYSLNDASIKLFIEKLNCIPDFVIEIEGTIKELKHQDYHGKCVNLSIKDKQNNIVKSKIDIGVHNHLEIEQEKYCFDVCMDDKKVYLLKNTIEQTFVEKVRSLLIFGSNSHRYKDVYDLFYLKNVSQKDILIKLFDVLIFKDQNMKENNMKDVIKRIETTFDNKQYMKRLSSSKQRWLDDNVEEIGNGIVLFLKQL